MAISTTDPLVTARQVLEDVPKGLLIDGEWCPGSQGTLTVENPADGSELCSVADAGLDDAERATAAAAAAQGEWAQTPARTRSDILMHVHELMVANRERLATLITLEMGKPLAESRGEVDYSIGFVRWFAEEAVRIEGHFGFEPNGNGRIAVLRQPVGPCVLVTPWNFPLAMGARKIAPAIAAGCTMTVKPAKQTPLTSLALGQLLIDAGTPAGVVNMLTTSTSGPLVEKLLGDSRYAKLSFTGSTAVGKHLVELAAGQLLRVSMELGGNAPFLVFDDADLEAAVDGAMVAKMRNMGQACTAANRILVQEGVADRFTEMLAEKMTELVVGPGLEHGVDVGPMIDSRACEDLGGMIADAESRGATLAVGGGAIEGAGHFFQPTVVTDLDPGSSLLREEIFGPVAPVLRFGSDEEGVATANDTEYGLVSYVYTRDVGRALRISESLQTGMVGLNRGLVSNPAAPFGGVKHSGYGREGGREGIEDYLDTKYIAIGE